MKRDDFLIRPLFRSVDHGQRYYDRIGSLSRSIRDYFEIVNDRVTISTFDRSENS